MSDSRNISSTRVKVYQALLLLLDVGLHTLGVKVNTAVTCVEAPGDPMNPCMLQIVGSWTPICCKAGEEYHL